MPESFASSPQSAEQKQSPERWLKKHEGKKVFESREQALEEIEKELVGIQDARYGPGGKYFLRFHNSNHTRKVAEVAVEILKKIQEVEERHGVPESQRIVKPEDIILVTPEALGHDLIQNSVKEKWIRLNRARGYKKKDVMGFRKSVEKKRDMSLLEPFFLPDGTQAESSDAVLKNLKGNERASADELITLLDQYYYRDADGRETPLFSLTEKKRREILDDIGATTPDPMLKPMPGAVAPSLRIGQPYLKKTSSIRALAIANADLRGPLNDPDTNVFRRSGWDELLELEKEAFVAELHGGIDEIPRERQIQATKMFLDWEKSQEGFAAWQKVLFLESLDENRLLNPGPNAGDRKKRAAQAIKQELKILFGITDDGQGAFDQNIRASHKYSRDLEETYGHMRNQDDPRSFRFLVHEVEV